jgi:hypothetical protein
MNTNKPLFALYVLHDDGDFCLLHTSLAGVKQSILTFALSMPDDERPLKMSELIHWLEERYASLGVFRCEIDGPGERLDSVELDEPDQAAA